MSQSSLRINHLLLLLSTRQCKVRFMLGGIEQSCDIDSAVNGPNCIVIECPKHIHMRETAPSECKSLNDASRSLMTIINLEKALSTRFMKLPTSMNRIESISTSFFYFVSIHCFFSFIFNLTLSCCCFCLLPPSVALIFKSQAIHG